MARTRLRRMRGRASLLLLPIYWVLSCEGLLAFPAQDVHVLNNRDYFPQVLQLIGEANQSIRVMMYLVQQYPSHSQSPTNQLLEALAQAKGRGVDVQVILEETSQRSERSEDLALKNRQVARFLKSRGIPVYKDSPEITTHAKVLVVDSRYTIIGSTNWTYAAMARNNEAAVLVDSRQIAQEYMQYFERVKASDN